MRPAFGGDGIDRFERHHVWVLRQESRDLLKSGRQIWIFAGDQIDDPLIIFWDCRCWSAALGRHSRSSLRFHRRPESHFPLPYPGIGVSHKCQKSSFAEVEIIVAKI
jgi:hypothetical protein